MHTTNVAQNSVVSGSVYCFKDLPLMNIKVEAKKSKSKVATDSLGCFQIVVAKNDKLIFTGGGFQKVVKNVKNKSTLRVKMVLLEGTKNEEIAVGYGHVSQKDLTYAVSHLSQYNNDFSNYPDIFSLIQGKFAGVQVVNAGGVKKVLVRGVTSFTQDIYAIYVVDGVVVDDISHISPNWVKSIDVLKDNATTIYGVRGANGVVLITTMR